MNSVTLVGRLARDPELNYTVAQLPVCHFTLAVNRPKKNGEDQGADFIRITVFGKQAENCDKFLAKGRQVAVHGRLHTDKIESKDGRTVTVYDVVADNVEFLGGGEPARKTDPDRYKRPDISFVDETGFRATDDGMPF